MNIEEIRNYCCTKKAAIEDFPFDESTLVFKIGGKMFGLLSLDDGETLNLKCTPERSIELREHYSFIIPGWHMNKTHWNTIYFKEAPAKLMKELIDHSYSLIFNKLPKKLQDEIIMME
ncbi:MAG: MmcQ-like protein [Bacteroidetes bacterium CG2_30_33_31]|nr:MAG: MmcQ-like protein [Bacteroidetes bacterium CG2_30_33_31]